MNEALFNLYLFNLAALVAYEGDDVVDDAVDDVVDDLDTGDAPPAKPNKTNKPKVFSQDDVNRFVADDRRANDKKYQKLETAYKEALENRNLTDKQRQELQDNLETLQATFRTKEENLKIERDRAVNENKKKVEELAQERDSWKNRFESTEIRRALTDAAIKGDAFRAEHILAILQPMTKMTPVLDSNGKATGDLAPRVQIAIRDPKTGEDQVAIYTAEEAVQYMKGKTDDYGNLFRAGGTGGAGTSNGAGSGPGRKLDVSKLSFEEHRKLRKDNPNAIYGK